MADRDDDQASSTRRRMLTGGAVLLGAAVVGSQGTAQAANGNSLLVGRTTNNASAETKLTSSGNVPGLRLVTTNAGGSAIGLYAAAKGGYGAYLESATNHGAAIWSKHKDRFGIVAVNSATTRGSGGAIRADGRENAGLFASTSAVNTPAIIARNTSPGASVNRRAVVATAHPSGQSQLDAMSFWRGAGEFAGANGVVGVCAMENGIGALGFSTQPRSTAVYAYGPSSTGATAFVASGNAIVTGSLSKGGGSFRIDHPLDPANKYLSHSFVESPDMMNVYNGNIVANATGEATVELPSYFHALNKDFRYQLTAVGAAAPNLHVKTKVADGRFTIAGAKPGQEVSWQLTGIRQDAWANKNRIPVEHAKSEADKGKYLFPQGFGRPESAAIHGMQGAR